MEAYYGDDLARIHDEGFGGYADSVAPAILEILDDPTDVLEVGCGTGRLTRHLVDAGMVVRATDSSPSMLQLARRNVPEARVNALILGEDPVPSANSIVSVGHVVNYLSSTDDVHEAVLELARAKAASGVLVFDVCDLSYGSARSGVRHSTAEGDGWTIDVTTIFEPPSRFIRGMTTRLDVDDGRLREGHETHINVLVSVDELVATLTDDGFAASAVATAGEYDLPEGMFLVVVTGQSNS